MSFAKPECICVCMYMYVHTCMYMYKIFSPGHKHLNMSAVAGTPHYNSHIFFRLQMLIQGRVSGSLAVESRFVMTKLCVAVLLVSSQQVEGSRSPKGD